MKKLFSILLVMMVSMGLNLSVLACECGCKCQSGCECSKLKTCECDYEIEGLYDGYQAVYMPSTKTWTNGGMAPDRIILTKKTSSGSGSYSEYYNSKGKLAVALNSNFEFIKDGQLIAVDNAGLKYSKVIYEKKKFKEVPLTDEELQKIFPNAEIIKISQFHNNKIKVDKKLFKTKEVLLVNDTDKYFHKYSFNKKVQPTDVKGLLKISKLGNLVYSLNGMEDGKITIKVR